MPRRVVKLLHADGDLLRKGIAGIQTELGVSPEFPDEVEAAAAEAARDPVMPELDRTDLFPGPLSATKVTGTQDLYRTGTLTVPPGMSVPIPVNAKVRIDDFGGLAARHPLLALTLAVFLLSLIGIPPTAGFVGKFYLFGAAVKSGYVWLAVIGVLNSAAAAYYYLRLIVYMYMREPEGAPTVLAPSLSGALALMVALWGVVQLGVAPGPLFDLAQAAVVPLLR